MEGHISISGLSHTYVDKDVQTTTLIDINLQASRGEFVSVVGPSGAGKTTLLKTIGGLVKPSSGQIFINGNSPKKAQRFKNIGFMMQDPSLIPWLNVMKNVQLPLKLNPSTNQDQSSRALEWIESVELTDYVNYFPHQLSGGMKQRVAFARAMVIDPDIMLMDEPLGALDEITRSSMQQHLLNVWEKTGKTVILVTHSIREAVMMSDRIIVLSPRPAKIIGEVRVNIPRPRNERLEHSDIFQQLIQETKKILEFTKTA